MRLDASAAAEIGEFQSAPLTGVRGDVLRSRAPVSAEAFQSAPLTGVRGDIRRRQASYRDE